MRKIDRVQSATQSQARSLFFAGIGGAGGIVIKNLKIFFDF
jgi:hypothetical protein